MKFNIVRPIPMSQAAILVENEITYLLRELMKDGYLAASQTFIAKCLDTGNDGRLTDALCRMAEKGYICGYRVAPTSSGHGKAFIWCLVSQRENFEDGIINDWEQVAQ